MIDYPDPDLWNIPERYPNSPGAKGTAETSRAAADSIDARTLRDLTLKVIAKRSSTADEVAAHLRLDKLSIRPRCSELKKFGQIVDSGERRINIDSGKRAVVWKIPT